MKDFKDVMDLWPSRAALAEDIGEPRGMVQQWYERNYIAADWYHQIVEAARRRVDAGDPKAKALSSITYPLLFQIGQEGRARKRESARARRSTQQSKAQAKKQKPNKRPRAELAV